MIAQPRSWPQVRGRLLIGTHRVPARCRVGTHRVPARCRVAARRAAAGFTLVELLLTLGLAAILMLLSFPALQNMIYRGKIEGVGRETEALMRLARYESIKRGVPARVLFDYPTASAPATIYAFADVTGSKTLDGTNPLLASYVLPNGVNFWQAQDPDANGPNSMMNMEDPSSTGGSTVFMPDGHATRSSQAVHFGDAKGNFLQILVSSPATGKVDMLKWDATKSAYVKQGSGGKPWQWQF
jgi:prepilin-type N-terminal cleavage/methylation domain-containing protein